MLMLRILLSGLYVNLLDRIPKFLHPSFWEYLSKQFLLNPVLLLRWWRYLERPELLTTRCRFLMTTISY
jgi:hypothetical protein